MIKRAHEEFGAPSEPYSEDCFLRLLMKQSEKNVEQVLFGKQDKTRIENQRYSELGIQATNLEDYPALNKLASTMSGTGAAKSVKEAHPEDGLQDLESK